jgi:hypothetical protein
MSDWSQHDAGAGDAHEARVRALAHRMWEDAGQPEGQQDHFWYEAERQLAGGSHHEEPADPHPADENPGNVYNPSPGGDIANENHNSDLMSDPHNPGSIA